MKNKDSSYYVPEQSVWPIIGALALLFLAFGSLNIEKLWGLIAFIVGITGLVFMLTGWLWNVTQESDAGLYNRQMDKTFRWGMCWFLISELFLFGLLIGSIIHVRFSITPWLAGQSGDASQLTHYLLWPDFAKHWPLIKPPGSTVAASIPSLASMRQIPLINLIILLSSALLLTDSLYHLKKMRYKLCRITLNIAIFLACIFLISQTLYFFHLIHAHIIAKSGVYGSFLIAFLGLHLINIVAALLFLCILCIRIYKNKLLENNMFSFDAAVWWWDFLAAVWALGFFWIF
ncbi:cytochrome c oxidase subunit 3 [Rickettsiella endosymbiont of Miltochrista miniata]|uniref:cytochrome c oxidase subunit 3 n=1 Tax=Rickettsiella endosymbiont of Miltochrista miniata TaxID=3066239 RepID=UPI00313B1299